MRLLIDSLIAAMLIGILAAVLLHHRREQQQFEQYRQVHQALAALHEQALYHAALAEAETRERRFPEELERDWFGGALPANSVAAAVHPWCDVAPEGDEGDHPPDPVLRTEDQAGFWYNAGLGVFRARVPAQEDDAATLALYNRLNGTALRRLPEEEDPARAPLRASWGRVRPSTLTPVVSTLVSPRGPGAAGPTASAAEVEAEPAAPAGPAKAERRTLSDAAGSE